MAIIRKRKQKQIYKSVDLDIDEDWLKKFYKLCGDSAWNAMGNEWLNKQFADGRTPRQARSECSVINF